ncbi:MAG: M81 family metallopeptidase [Minwuiales bacterium]|nr:M81 family metallopeptidase [Minwuiales bacterium]
MKVFIASLGTETNTFSPLPTGEETFAETMLFHGDATASDPSIFSGPLHVWRRKAEEIGGSVVESLAAFAQPAGTTVRPVYENFRDEIMADLKAALPVDMVLICMHGAMVADGLDDCEGDTVEALRQIVGPNVPIGLELDLHCHLTERMVGNASAIITFKEYPHIDFNERAEELFDLCLATARGEVKPTMSLYDCRMISMWRTPVEPMRGFVDRMQSLEGKDGVLSVSFGHGFPWGDVADVGAKMLVVTDNDPEKGAALAESLGRQIWEMREQTAPEHLDIDTAIDRALAAEGAPVVLADVSDNAGGGAPSDSTFILRRLLDRGVTDVASGCYWDPVAVRFCIEAGEGATFDLRIGGKCGVASGDPVDLTVTVRKILRDAVQTFGDSVGHLGDAVWVSAEGIDLVLNSKRTQTFHPDAFTNLGLDPAERKIVVVKSTQHFYAGFAPIAAAVLYVAAPGAIVPEFADIPFTKLAKPFWPKVEDPFAG